MLAVNPQAPFMPEWLFDYMPGRKINFTAAGKFTRQNLRHHYQPTGYYGNPRCFTSEKRMGVLRTSSVLCKRDRFTMITGLGFRL